MVTKKKVLGVDPLSWIKQTKEPEQGKKQEKVETEVKKKLPKFETCEVKLTVRLTEEQLAFLADLEREIMKKRSKVNKKERITKNSIIRAAVENLKRITFDRSEIPNEEELTKRLLLNSKG